MSGDDPLVTAAGWDQFYRENPDAVMSDLYDEMRIRTMRMIPKSEDGHEAEELTEGQTKEEQQKIILEEIILGNIEFQLRKTTDNQPPMEAKDTKKYKKWPKKKTEAYQAKFKEVQAEMMRTRVI